GSGDQDSGKGTGCDASGTLSPAALLLAIPLLLIAFKRTAK
ncbi:MAG: SYNERG-CTERM sorting domain-containing protein, partial [Dehalococcoidales bacterium]|nr:SYNERG-CTERM sorting domain-containing protein [Dehalococcoidales bacterium]